MTTLKVLLLCSTRFALPAMRDLLYSGSLAAVVIPEHGEEMIEEVRSLLNAPGISVIAVNKENNSSELKKAIKKYDAALVMMLTYPFKISKEIYSLPLNGFFNFHPGPLPEYRGPDPVFQQVLRREAFAGVTVHRVDEGMDTGPVVIKEMLRTDPADTYGILNNKLAELAAKLAGILLKMAALDLPIPSKPQDESKARYFKRQTSADIVIRWDTMDAESIIGLIHACNPWNKGAVTSVNNKIIRLLDAEKTGSKNTEEKLPGTVIAADAESLTVAAINGECIRIGYVYIDEGFMKAGRLTAIGVNRGSRFTGL